MHNTFIERKKKKKIGQIWVMPFTFKMLNIFAHKYGLCNYNLRFSKEIMQMCVDWINENWNIVCLEWLSIDNTKHRRFHSQTTNNFAANVNMIFFHIMPCIGFIQHLNSIQL